MGAPASTRRGKGIRARWSVAVLAALATLAVAPPVQADPGGTTDVVIPAAPDGSSSPGHAGGDPGATADPPDATSADAAGGPGNAGDGADLPGKSEKSDDRPGNAANAPGHADDEPAAAAAASGEEAKPRSEVDQGASVGQKADAAASAGQRNVENTSVAVRIDDPGNGKKVGQENRASADADASVSTVVDTAGPTTVQQEAGAAASAEQSGAANTAVVVRVGSAGDDDGVSQLNLAAAAATASATSDGVVSGSGSATAGATQEGVTNTSVSVRVFSPGDDGPVSQVNAASATSYASAEDAAEYAATQQDGAQNTSLSIRVDSPGSSAGATQQNQTTADVGPPPGDGVGAGSVAVAVSSDSRNTTLAVAVAGADLDRPGPTGLQVWIWNWAWQRDESDSLEGLVRAAMTSWTWDWDDGKSTAPGGTITSRAADEDDDEHAGSWKWSWDWSRAGVAGWTWGWSWQGSLPCGSCIWIWNWTWSWVGQPGDDGSAVPPVPTAPDDPSSAAQLNAAQAQATAAATARVVQVVSQDGSSGWQSAGQLTAVVQDAAAVADAQQADVGALAWGIGRLAQRNVVSSDAAVALSGTTAQGTDQVLDAADRAGAEQWAGQEVDLAQAGRADAASSQHDAVMTGRGAHFVASVAAAAGIAAVDQQVFQVGAADGGTLAQRAGQLALVEQDLDADAATVQTGTRRSRTVGGTAGASASATDLVVIQQLAGQWAARVAGTGSQAVFQAAYAAQDAFASAMTTQQAGAAGLPAASSDADALNRAAIVQEAAQSSFGGEGLDFQDILQTSIVVQQAVASSVSLGGIAGSAAVVNCGVTQQAAVQSTGSGVTLPGTDPSAFCAPAASPPGPSPVASAPFSATGDEALAASGHPSSTAPTAGDQEKPAVFRGGRDATGAGALPPRAARAHGAPAARLPARREPAPTGNHRSSALHSTQARLDTRPGSHAGIGDAGREPPLPPAGDPPTWVSALAAAVSGAGSSGIAAIVLAFVLVPPVLLRTREGSVVRRPASVLARIDVPV